MTLLPADSGDTLSMDDGRQPMAEINMIPMIDIMLVLLIIFILTAPLLTNAVRLELPPLQAAANDTPPEVLTVAIDAGGQRFCDGDRVSADGMRACLQAAAQRQPRPPVQLRIDRHVPYGDVAPLLAVSAQLGLTDIAFVGAPVASAEAMTESTSNAGVPTP